MTDVPSERAGERHAEALHNLTERHAQALPVLTARHAQAMHVDHSTITSHDVLSAAVDHRERTGRLLAEHREREAALRAATTVLTLSAPVDALFEIAERITAAQAGTLAPGSLAEAKVRQSALGGALDQVAAAVDLLGRVWPAAVAQARAAAVDEDDAA